MNVIIGDILDGLNVAMTILKLVGFAFIFKKFHEKWWYALVPMYNDYKLAQCADKEEDGFVWCISNLLANIFLSTYDLLDSVAAKSMLGYVIVLLMTVFLIINLIYSFRIYSSLARIFNRKKTRVFLWAVSWLTFTGITSIIWGLSSKFIPTLKEDTSTNVSMRDSNIKTETLKNGLTIDINERSVYNRFKKKVLLRDIHLNINSGKMVLLLGGSGAGKTTFFNAVTGYEKADATILLNGIDVYRDFDKMKYEIGFVPQQELLRSSDTVIRTLEDSALLRLPKGVSARERTSRTYEVIEKFGLNAIKENIISKQSGGQKKRISIAMEYISNPSLFILDEPDSGLDGILARELMSGLHDISRENKIVIVVTHTPDRVIEFFDEVIVLGKDSSGTGRLVFNGSVDEARKYFEVDSMEGIVKKINRPEEGGDGKADELIARFWEVNHEQQ